MKRQFHQSGKGKAVNWRRRADKKAEKRMEKKGSAERQLQTARHAGRGKLIFEWP